jgi:predicted AAA+ superfamily ATPase
MLPLRVGSQLSLNALREDLEVSHRTVAHWIALLEQLYFCYRIFPFAGRLMRSLKKEAKLYLWDWAAVKEPGARFENMIAGHLLKLCHTLEDREGYAAKLWYLRDRNKHEVDFLVTIDAKPWFAVEAKLSHLRKNHMLFFKERLNIPHAYSVALGDDRFYESEGVTYTSARRFLSSLGV